MESTVSWNAFSCNGNNSPTLEISFQPSEPISEQTPDSPVDSTLLRQKPEIRLENSLQSLELVAGEYHRVPKGFARDDDQKDISDQVTVSVQEAKGLQIINGYLKASLCGDYHLIYSVKDEWEQTSTLSLPVHVLAKTASTFDLGEFSDLSAFPDVKTEFRDDLEKKEDSPLFKDNQMTHISFVSDERAISGTSLLVDYTKLNNMENRVFFDAMSSHLKTGKWTISFDVKAVYGFGFSDFYVGYGKQGSADSVDLQLSLENLGYGETQRVTYTGILNIEEGSDYFFHFFKLEKDKNLDVMLCFDNFSFSYETVDYTFYTPTVSEMKADGGAIIDWDSKFLPMTSAVPQKVDEIAQEDVKAALQGSDGFGDTCLYMYGKGDHLLTGISKEKDPQYFEVGMAYTISFDYYAMSVSQHYLIVIDGTTSNVNVASSFLKQGLNHAELKFNVPKNAKEITFFGSYDMYVGKMTISLTKASVSVREDVYCPTQDELIAPTGYTWNYEEGNAVDLGGLPFADVSALDENVKTEIASCEGFSSQVIKADFINGGGRLLESVSGTLAKDYQYTLSFNAYCESGKTVLVLLFGNAQIGSHYTLEKSAVTGMTHIYHYEVTFTPKDGASDPFKTIMLYPQDTFTMLIGDMTLKGVKA